MRVFATFEGFCEAAPPSVQAKADEGCTGSINMGGTDLEDSYDPQFTFVQNSQTKHWLLAHWSQDNDRTPPWLYMYDAAMIRKEMGEGRLTSRIFEKAADVLERAASLRCSPFDVEKGQEHLIVAEAVRHATVVSEATFITAPHLTFPRGRGLKP